MSGRSRPVAPRQARMPPDAPPGGSVLIAGIVLALLSVAAILVALLYGVGELRDGPHNVTEFGTPEAVLGEPASDPS